MRRIIQVISWLALGCTILPPVLFLAGAAELESVQQAMLISTVVWFVATPMWMGRENHSESGES